MPRNLNEILCSWIWLPDADTNPEHYLEDTFELSVAIPSQRSRKFSGPVLRIRIRDSVPFLPLDPGSGIGFSRSRIPDLVSWIPNPYFWELWDIFWGKKFYNALKIGPNFFLQHFKIKIVKFCEIYDSKEKLWQQIFFTNVFHCCFWIRDPGSGMG